MVHTKLSDEEILTMILSGDEGSETLALTSLYEEYWHSMTAIIRRYKLPIGDIDDVFQLGIIGLYKYIKRGKADLSKGPLKALMTRIVTNISGNWKRNKRLDSHTSLDRKDAMQVPFPDDFFNYLEQTDEQKEILEKIALLGEKCKQILVMYYYDEFSFEVITIRMNMSNAAAAKMAKSRCLKKLRTYFLA